MFVDSATVKYATFIFGFKTKMAIGFNVNSSAASSSCNSSNTTFSRSILELNLDEDSYEDVVAKEDPIRTLFSDSETETN